MKTLNTPMEKTHQSPIRINAKKTTQEARGWGVETCDVGVGGTKVTMMTDFS